MGSSVAKSSAFASFYMATVYSKTSSADAREKAQNMALRTVIGQTHCNTYRSMRGCVCVCVKVINKIVCCGPPVFPLGLFEDCIRESLLSKVVLY